MFAVRLGNQGIRIKSWVGGKVDIGQPLKSDFLWHKEKRPRHTALIPYAGGVLGVGPFSQENRWLHVCPCPLISPFPNVPIFEQFNRNATSTAVRTYPFAHTNEYFVAISGKVKFSCQVLRLFFASLDRDRKAHPLRLLRDMSHEADVGSTEGELLGHVMGDVDSTAPSRTD